MTLNNSSKEETFFGKLKKLFGQKKEIEGPDLDKLIHGSLIEKANIIDKMFGEFLDPKDPSNLRFIEVPASYLPDLADFQLEFIEQNNIPYEYLPIEQKLRLLCNRAVFDREDFKSLYSAAQNKDDLIYDWVIRERLIELGIVVTSPPNDKQIRVEFERLQKSFFEKEQSDAYKYSYQISAPDLLGYTDKEREILLDVLQSDSRAISGAASNCLYPNKVSYGSWVEYWKTLCRFKPGERWSDNSFLHDKYFTMMNDGGTELEIERVDMSIFPNLPSFYTSEGYEPTGFIEEIDWNRNFELHEIEMILAVIVFDYQNYIPEESKPALLERVEKLLVN